jgi:hypothetical protein
MRVYVMLLGHNGKPLRRDPDRASVWAQSKDDVYRETEGGKPCFSVVVETPSLKVRASASVLYRGAEREIVAAEFKNPGSPMQFQLRVKKAEWFNESGPIPLDKLPENERRELLASVASSTANANAPTADAETRAREAALAILRSGSEHTSLPTNGTAASWRMLEKTLVAEDSPVEADATAVRDAVKLIQSEAKKQRASE